LAQSSWAHPTTVGAGQQGKEERGRRCMPQANHSQ
jgi:hypothetical protein